MMFISNLSSHVDFSSGVSSHIMTVGLETGEHAELSIDSTTYGQLVSAFEYLSSSSGIPTPALSAASVSQQVTEHLGHQLAPGPVPEEEEVAVGILRQLEQDAQKPTKPVEDLSSPEDLLRSVGFFSNDEFTSVEDDGEDEDPGELFEDDDGVEGF